MKKFVMVLIGSWLLLNPLPLSADEGHGASLEEVMESIYQEQGVNSREQVSCNLLSEETLEELGEAVMSEMHPDNEVHEQMDEMMGGEGSESLRLAHINMGQSYLGCNTGYGPGMMMGSRRMGGMMGYNRNFNNQYVPNNWSPMMGARNASYYQSLPYFGNVNAFSLLVYAALLVFLGSGAYYFIQAASNSKKGK